jgi:hypothetical protein
MSISNTSFRTTTASLPLAANNCGFVNSVIKSSCNLSNSSIVNPTGQWYADYLFWNPTAGSAGEWVVGSDTVNLGQEAAANNFLGSTNFVAIGNRALRNGGANGCVAIGESAARYDAQPDSIAIGSYAGNGNVLPVGMGQESIAIGKQAGFISLGANSIAIGSLALRDNLTPGPTGCIAIGSHASQYSANYNSVAIGTEAGRGVTGGFGISSIAIGAYAAESIGHDNTIVLNSSGAPLNTSQPGSTYISDIRKVVNDVSHVRWDTVSKELTVMSSQLTIAYSDIGISALLTFPNFIFNTIVHGGNLDPLTGIYTAPHSGIYLISFQVYVISSGSGTAGVNFVDLAAPLVSLAQSTNIQFTLSLNRYVTLVAGNTYAFLGVDATTIYDFTASQNQVSITFISS